MDYGQNTNIDILECLYHLLPQLPNFYEDEISFLLADKTKLLSFVPSEHMSKSFLNVGQSIPKDDVLYKAISTGKTQSITTDRSSFGFHIRVVAIPIKDLRGNIIGAVSYGRSLKNSTELLDLSTALASTLNKVNEKSNLISHSIKQISNSNSEVLGEVRNTASKVNETDNIIKFINGVVSQTKLLGLNASIEAARVGEAGKGFGVVASEIRKLSASSSSSINEITNVIKTIQQSVQDIELMISDSNISSDEQSRTILEIIESLNNLSSTAARLASVANKL